MKHFLLNEIQPSEQTLQIIKFVARSYRPATIKQHKYENAYYFPVVACC